MPDSSAFDAPPPLVIAHRAANRLTDLTAAARLAGVLAEADLRLRGRRLEVRHARSLSPLPLLVDGWSLAMTRSRLRFHELLEVASPEVRLLLDLKGTRARLSRRLLHELDPHLARRQIMVCARHWPLLEPFRHTPVRRLYSVGSARELRRLLREHPTGVADGVSIHEALLDAETLAAIGSLAETVLAWTVNHRDRARELLRLGVDGLITDRPEEMWRLVVSAPRRRREPGHHIDAACTRDGRQERPAGRRTGRR